MTKELLLIVDGHNLLFRAFFGIPARLLPSGKPVHGTIGFLGLLRKIVTRVEPTHVVIVFDAEDGGTRKSTYEGYKANRTDFAGVDAAMNPFTQLADIVHCLEKLHIAWQETPGVEADDVIASYALCARMPAVVASWDSDFFQLVDERVSVLRYHGKATTHVDEAWVRAKFGVPPERFVDYKAWVGDAADNIKGVRGVGPKTAARLVRGERHLTDEDALAVHERNRALMLLKADPTLVNDMDTLRYLGALGNIRIGQWLKDAGVL